MECNRIQRDNVFYVICSMKASRPQSSAAENVALKQDWPTDDVDATGVSGPFRNVVLLCKDDMQTWMTPSLFVPRGSTPGGEVKIIAEASTDDYY